MKKRIRIISEVLTVYLLFIGVIWSVKLVPDFSAWQDQVFEGYILTTFAAMILLPFAAMWLNHKKSGSGKRVFSLSSLKRAAEVAGKSLSVMMPVTFLSFPVVQVLGFTFLSWEGAGIIAFWHLLSIPALCLIFRNFDQTEDKFPSLKELGITISVFAGAILLVFALTYVHSIAARILIALIFVGQAEEFLFRGYIQTRLNQAFEKPFSIFGFSFGWGIISASLLFGLMHVLSPGNPWHWAWGFWTFFGGFCFGIIREKAGSFVASGLVHGIIMIFPVVFS